MGYVRSTSLNGYWERMRRLLRMLGGDALPEGLTGVVIVGDTREPGASNVSYRRFSVTASWSAAIAALTDFTFRPDVDVVVERAIFGFVVNQSAQSELRILSKSEVTASGGVYNACTSANSAWLDNPDGSSPPVSLRGGGTRLGNAVHYWSASAIPQQVFEYPLFLPAGSAVSFYMPNNGGTLGCMTLCGYVR